MTEAAESAEADQRVDPAQPGNRVVGGFGGSDGSLAAVGWPLHEARLRGVTLHAVLGCNYHASSDGAGLGSTVPMGCTSSGGALGGDLAGARISAPVNRPTHIPQSTDTDAAALAIKVLDAVISDVVEHDPDSAQQPVKITRVSVHGHAATVLRDEITESDLLVVSSRGHGAFLGALLGSVSHHVVAQAPCPVVVVPGPAMTAREGQQ